MKNYLFFDIDDTLIDTSRNAYKKHVWVCKQLKQPIIDELTYRGSFGRKTFDEMIEMFIPKIDKKEYMEWYKKSKKYYPYIGIYKDLKEYIIPSLQKEYFLGILTNGNKLKTEEKLEVLGIRDILFLILYEENLLVKKPNPKAFNKVLEIVGNKNIVYVADSLEDYYATKGTKITFRAVTTGVFSRRDFLEAGVEEKNIIDNLYNYL